LYSQTKNSCAGLNNFFFFVQSFVRNCGSIQTGTSGLILSPNFPASYGNNLYCEWYITAPTRRAITLTINSFSSEYGPDRLFFQRLPTCESAITTPFLTGILNGTATLSFAQNQLLLAFYSDSSLSTGSFSISWTTV
jgi:hypothetical protein